MKKVTVMLLAGMIVLSEACKKSEAEKESPTSYIAFLQTDSLNAYLKPSNSTDTFQIRKKLKSYSLKILKKHAIIEDGFQSAFYTNAKNNGFIVVMKNIEEATKLKLDKRIDSLHKSIPVAAF